MGHYTQSECLLKIQEFLNYSFRTKIHAVREFLDFHSGINNLTFLLLYETTLLGKWLQTFR
jgi:hypothetical protein